MDRLLNWRESCAMLNISKQTLYKLTNSGELSRIRVSDRRVCWQYSDLLLFIERHRY
jgi:excisionase family DNA binding protein